MKKIKAKLLITTVITIAIFIAILRTNNEILLIPYFFGLAYVVEKSIKYLNSKDKNIK